jgi:hypothetical protein
VTDLVNLDRVRGLLRTIVCRRKFLAQQARSRAAEANGTSPMEGVLNVRSCDMTDGGNPNQSLPFLSMTMRLRLH